VPAHIRAAERFDQGQTGNRARPAGQFGSRKDRRTRNLRGRAEPSKATRRWCRTNAAGFREALLNQTPDMYGVMPGTGGTKKPSCVISSDCITVELARNRRIAVIQSEIASIPSTSTNIRQNLNGPRWSMPDLLFS